MTNSDIAQRRLHTQHMAGEPLKDPVEVVGWLGAVQSQDYPGAKWSLGMRTPGLKEADIDALFDDGAFLRTHILRPTWHFVLPEDIRWMQALTAPRVAQLLATYDRKLGVDEDVLARSSKLMADALRGNNFMTRPQLMAVLQKAGINTEGTQRAAHLVMHAELDAVLCSGPRRGKTFTYALVEERAPQARSMRRDEALAELTRRYFTSHGPATAADFAWWSGLTRADARAGIEMVGSALAREEIDGQTYYSSPEEKRPAKPFEEAILLPTYDEYIIGYTDRSAVIDRSWAELVLKPKLPAFDSMLVIGGMVVGTWRRVLKPRSAVVEIIPFGPLDERQSQAVTAAIERFGVFLGVPVELR